MKSISILTLISISVSAALVSISDSLVNWRLPIPERFEIAGRHRTDSLFPAQFYFRDLM